VRQLFIPGGGRPSHVNNCSPPLNSSYRLLRAILSVNDEFYHRHIIQHSLFEPVFETFRANPVGDNLVSSAIVEICDFIHSENVKSLIEHIATKHLSISSADGPMPSLEDVSSPYVSTLTELRRAYEKNLKAAGRAPSIDILEGGADAHSRYFHGGTAVRGTRAIMSERALEDQVRSVTLFQTIEGKSSRIDFVSYQMFN
jgi:hypothetical protein